MVEYYDEEIGVAVLASDCGDVADPLRALGEARLAEMLSELAKPGMEAMRWRSGGRDSFDWVVRPGYKNGQLCLAFGSAGLVEAGTPKPGLGPWAWFELRVLLKRGLIRCVTPGRYALKRSGEGE